MLNQGMSKPKPPEPLVRKTVTLPASLWAAVEAHRLAEAIGSEMETIRQLVKAGVRETSRQRRQQEIADGTPLRPYRAREPVRQVPTP